ncbi:MAG: hypothetical protein IT435_05805 [Phycisphaerales bacterium]|nr:hypothetical protein [Phycisphaerales bacterium]
MTHPHIHRLPDNLPGLIDAYLDGRLNDQQRSELERLARANPSIARELDDARLADERLRKMFTLPRSSELIPKELQAPTPIPFHAQPTAPAAASAIAAARVSTSRRPLIYAAAAALLLALGAGIYFINRSPSTGPAKAAPSDALTPGDLYATLLKRKFKPAFICENDEQFAKFLGDRFGSGAVLASAEGVEILGWAYADGMVGEATAVIMTKVDGAETILVVDEKKFDRPQAAPPAELKMFRSECNGLVFYEITPLPEARLTPLIKAAPPLYLRTD